MYGMSMPVPKSWEDFQVYWGLHVPRGAGEHLAARAVLDLVDHARNTFHCNGFRIGCGSSSSRLPSRSGGVADRRAVRRTGARTHGLPWSSATSGCTGCSAVPVSRQPGVQSSCPGAPDASRARAWLGPRRGRSPRTHRWCTRLHATCRPSPSAARASTTHRRWDSARRA